MSKLDYAGFKSRLKVGKGVLFNLATGQTLAIVPYKSFDLPKTQHTKLLVSITHSKSQALSGAYIWDLHNPPITALKMVIGGFPLRLCGAVYAVVCRILFPLVHAKYNPQLLLACPQNRDNAFRKFSKPKKKAKAKTTKPKTTKKKNHEHIEFSVRQETPRPRTLKDRRRSARDAVTC